VFLISPKITVNKKNIRKIEKEIFVRVNKTISVLEVAIAAWDASDKKPDEKRVLRYKALHRALTRLERKLLHRSDDEEFSVRLKRIRDFVHICRLYCRGGPHAPHTEKS
jgi:hypothetical protein